MAITLFPLDIIPTLVEVINHLPRCLNNLNSAGRVTVTAQRYFVVSDRELDRFARDGCDG